MDWNHLFLKPTFWEQGAIHRQALYQMPGLLENHAVE
jgi:hypothetical protein